MRSPWFFPTARRGRRTSSPRRSRFRSPYGRRRALPPPGRAARARRPQHQAQAPDARAGRAGHRHFGHRADAPAGRCRGDRPEPSEKPAPAAGGTPGPARGAHRRRKHRLRAPAHGRHPLHPGPGDGHLRARRHRPGEARAGASHRRDDGRRLGPALARGGNHPTGKRRCPAATTSSTPSRWPACAMCATTTTSRCRTAWTSASGTPSAPAASSRCCARGRRGSPSSATSRGICPGAVVMNYTNPMSALTLLALRATRLSVVGLCHSVQETSQQIATYLELPFDELRFQCRGHQPSRVVHRAHAPGEGHVPAPGRARQRTPRCTSTIRCASR